MQRSIKFSLAHLTQTKRAAITAVLREYRAAINFYMKSLWDTKGKLNAETLKRYTGGSVGYNQRALSLKVALETVVATKKAAQALGVRASRPKLRGSVRLSRLGAKVAPYQKTGFDYAVTLSTLISGSPITIPLKTHRVLQKWLAMPGAKLLDGCVLNEDSIALYVDVPDPPEKVIGRDLGLDTGYRKLAATSDGKVYGTEFSQVCATVRRKKPGSRGKHRAQAMRKQYIDAAVKQLPWADMRTIVLEDLTGLKLDTQKKEKSSKKSRKTMAPWTYRQVLNRIEHLAQEHRVRLAFVDPRNTSRRCPDCGWTARENRVRENFCCVRCHYSADADLVGATNILARMTGNWQDNMMPASSNQPGPERAQVG